MYRSIVSKFRDTGNNEVLVRGRNGQSGLTREIKNMNFVSMNGDRPYTHVELLDLS